MIVVTVLVNVWVNVVYLFVTLRLRFVSEEFMQEKQENVEQEKHKRNEALVPRNPLI